MPYFDTWEEFVVAAQALFEASPHRCRLVTKYRPAASKPRSKGQKAGAGAGAGGAGTFCVVVAFRVGMLAYVLE